MVLRVIDSEQFCDSVMRIYAVVGASGRKETAERERPVR